MQFMRPQEVVVGDPERKIVVGTVVVIKSVCRAVRSFVGTVKSFDHLLIRSEFFRNSIIVRKADDLGDLELKLFTGFMEELLGGKGICTVTVSDEAEVFRQLFQMLEGHAHRHNAGADTTVISHLIADHSPGSSIDDQPDIAFDAADFDVSLISSKGRSFFVRICVNKRFDTDGGGFTVVGDHLVGYGGAMDVFHGLCGFSEGQTEIDPVGEAQGHDVSAVFSEFQRRCILRQGGDIHLEEIYREFTVDVMQLIFVFAVVLIQICLVNLLEVVEIVRALGIHAFMDDEMLPVFLTGQRMGTVRTLERKRLGETALIW